jgi:hypothetical protein
MKSLSRSKSLDRIQQRERRYPIYSAIDFMLQCLLCLGVFVFAAALLGLILVNNSPQFHSQVAMLLRQVIS